MWNHSVFCKLLSSWLQGLTDAYLKIFIFCCILFMFCKGKYQPYVMWILHGIVILVEDVCQLEEAQ